jgi:hypothetical protein
VFQVRDGNDSRVSLRLDGGRVGIGIQRNDNGNFQLLATSSGLSWEAGLWYHVAATYDANTAAANDSVIRFYRTPEGNTSGTPVLIQTLTNQPDLKPLTAGANLRVGGLDGLAVRNLGGDVDEVRYSNVVRTDFNLDQPAPFSVRPYDDNRAPTVAALFHLDGNGNDSSGNGLDLTASNSPFITVSGPPGLDQAAGPFNNGNKSLNRSGLSAADVGRFNTETFTIEAWVRDPALTSGGDAMGILQFRDGNNSRVAMRLDNQFRLMLAYQRADTGAFDYVRTSSPLQFDPGQWYHLAVTYEGDGTGNDSAVKFYETPLSDTSGVATLLETVTAEDIMPLTAGGALRVGTLDGSTGRSFGGYIDEVRYTNLVLAPNQFNLAVPEPSTWLLLAAGMVMLLPALRRRRR